MAAAWFALGVLALLATVSTDALAQTPAMDPAATQILKRMTDYLGGLQKFSVTTQNTLEDQLISGHRVDYDFSASVTVRRPNKLRAVRLGDLMDQRFFYDGKTLTLYNPSDKVYATTPAPDTIEKTIDFARKSIGHRTPGRRFTLPQRLSAADGGGDPGEGGRQGGRRRGQVRSSALQPPGGRFSGLGRRRQTAITAQVCGHQHGNPIH